MWQVGLVGAAGPIVGRPQRHPAQLVEQLPRGGAWAALLPAAARSWGGPNWMLRTAAAGHSLLLSRGVRVCVAWEGARGCILGPCVAHMGWPLLLFCWEVLLALRLGWLTPRFRHQVETCLRCQPQVWEGSQV
jgi:hypothetical protein